MRNSELRGEVCGGRWLVPQGVVLYLIHRSGSPPSQRGRQGVVVNNQSAGIHPGRGGACPSRKFGIRNAEFGIAGGSLRWTMLVPQGVVLYLIHRYRGPPSPGGRQGEVAGARRGIQPGRGGACPSRKCGIRNTELRGKFAVDDGWFRRGWGKWTPSVAAMPRQLPRGGSLTKVVNTHRAGIQPGRGGACPSRKFGMRNSELRGKFAAAGWFVPQGTVLHLIHRCGGPPSPRGRQGVVAGAPTKFARSATSLLLPLRQRAAVEDFLGRAAVGGAGGGRFEILIQVARKHPVVQFLDLVRPLAVQAVEAVG